MTDHPSALVSVPVEPTAAMLRAAIGWREFDSRDGLTGEASMFERAYHAMLAAAPADPQAAGVGEEAIDRFERAAFANVQNLPRGEAARAAEMDRRDVEYKAARLALRAQPPSREPEGGAVECILDRLNYENVRYMSRVGGLSEWIVRFKSDIRSAPDALRLAAADLLAEVDATAARIGWADHGQRERLRRALAALQAEQGAK